MWPLQLKDAASFDVVGVGGNTDDHVCVVARPPGSDAKQRLTRYMRQPGGQVPTALVALQRWGARTSYLGVFGDDEGGARQRASLAAEGVDTGRTVLRTSSGSHTSIILVDRITGARTVLWEASAALHLAVDEVDSARIDAARVVLLDDQNVDTALHVARRARNAGARVVLDIDAARSGDSLMPQADVVIVANGFPQRLTGVSDVRSALRRMGRRGAMLTVVTFGAGGALALCDGRIAEVPAFAVPVVDTTSAGDVFHAGVIYGLLQQWPFAETLRFASAAAALECTALGGRDAIPSLRSVRALIGG
jgi:sugar/nucleoside kinase (ribokinase family)